MEKNPEEPGKGYVRAGGGSSDTAPPGEYDFKRAFNQSSNSYFINVGLTHAGVDRIIPMARNFISANESDFASGRKPAGIFRRNR